MSPVLLAWAQFVAIATSIGFAGYHLSRYGDLIAQRTGLSGSWIGLILLATVTSLPELATGITAVTIAQAPNVAVGNALGSCVMNLSFLVLIDFLSRGESVYRRASQGHILAAAFGVVLLGFVGVNLVANAIGAVPGAAPGSAAAPATRLPIPEFGTSVSTPLILLLYLVAMRTVFVHERAANGGAGAGHAGEGDGRPGLRHVVAGFGAAALVVVAAGIWLPFAALELADAMGWSGSFVGTLFVSVATTMPELAVTVSALRLGALDLAIGNLLGSNLFNLAILAIDDLFYRPGPLLASASPVHAMTVFSALTMTGLAVVGLFYRPQRRVMRAVGWVSLGLAAISLLNGYVIFLHGE